MMYNTVRFCNVSGVISGIKYERLKLEGENVRARGPPVSKHRGEKQVGRKERKGRRKKKRGKREKDEKRISMKAAELAGGSLLRLSFFPACELHKGNMYTPGCRAAFRIAFPFTEISEIHRFLRRNSAPRAFHDEVSV